MGTRPGLTGVSGRVTSYRPGYGQGMSDAGTDATQERAIGALYGVALGDAMGTPGELWSRRRIREYFGRIEDFLPAPDRPLPGGLRPGQVTDDTQQTVMLARSVLRCGGRVEVADLARELLAWADRLGEAESLLGPSSSRAFAALRAGADPGDTGVAGTSNGAAMRVVPLGLLCPSGDLEALVAEVEASCAIAHLTGPAIAGAAMVAAAVSAALDEAVPAAEVEGKQADGAEARPVETGGEEAIERILTVALRAGEIGEVRGLDVAGPSVVARARLAISIARQARRTRQQEDAFLDELSALLGAGVETSESVPAALALVVHAHGRPRRAAVLAANLGGDTDTVGAIAAGICGALSGIGAIPPGDLATLRAVNGLELETLASGLLAFRAQRAQRLRLGWE